MQTAGFWRSAVFQLLQTCQNGAGLRYNSYLAFLEDDGDTYEVPTDEISCTN